MATILIADDHQILADGVRGLLENEFEVIGIASNGEELFAAAQSLHPDVIVADISMPVMNGIEAAIKLREIGSTAKIIFLTMHNDATYARRAIEAGAVGFVLKHAVSAELLTAVHDVLLGKTYITPMIAGELLQAYQEVDTSKDETANQLTKRQQEVVKLVADGHSAKQIALALHISIRTAEAHKARILETLGFESTAELVKYAIRHGLSSLD